MVLKAFSIADTHVFWEESVFLNNPEIGLKMLVRMYKRNQAVRKRKRRIIRCALKIYLAFSAV